MHPILCFGEALIDCFQTGSELADGLELPQFTHYPGGAPANVAVAVAKLGGKSYFSGQVGSDAAGDFLKKSLEHYRVNTTTLFQHACATTPLAFVTLDSDGERSFSFYRTNTADLLFQDDMIEWGNFSHTGLFHICSNTLTTPEIYKTTLSLIQQAKDRNWKISFDINYRSNLWDEPDLASSRISAVVALSDVVKASKEEMECLYPENTQSLAQHWAKDRFIIITDGGAEITSYFKQKKWTTSTPHVNAVDTTSAGDGFVGGLLFKLSNSENWSNTSCKQAVEFGAKCGAITVSRKGAYPALPWGKELNE